MTGIPAHYDCVDIFYKVRISVNIAVIVTMFLQPIDVPIAVRNVSQDS